MISEINRRWIVKPKSDSNRYWFELWVAKTWNDTTLFELKGDD